MKRHTVHAWLVTLLLITLSPRESAAQGITLLASAARGVTAGATQDLSTLLPNPQEIRALVIFLDVTAAATDATDTLDVYLQTKMTGTVFDDVLHFTQVLGNGGAKRFIAVWTRDTSPESELHAPADAALAAGVLQGPIVWNAPRLKWVIVDPGAGVASFTFSVTGFAIRDR